MLSPAPKTKAASIWSFDSGYGSGALEDEGFQVQFYSWSDSWHTTFNFGQIGQPGSSTTYGTLSSSLNQHDQSNTGDSSNLEAEDSVRLRAITGLNEPQPTELDVFTAKVRSSNESLSPTQNDEIDCLRCQLLDIINPGENIRCDDCTSGDLETLGAVTGANELPRPTTVAPRLDLLIAHPSKVSSQPESTLACIIGFRF